MLSSDYLSLAYKIETSLNEATHIYAVLKTTLKGQYLQDSIMKMDLSNDKMEHG
tara:strand:- start:72196 stop:72357 length:162 start_codon:yes stop_codon:yes gene_type:complete